MAGKKRQTTTNVSKDTKKNNKILKPVTKEPTAESKSNSNEPEKPTIATILKEREYVIKSPLDSNDYLVIQLPNGLKAFLISTCSHEKDLGNEQINPKTGAFVKVEEFNQKFVNLPPNEKSRKTSSRGGNNDDDCLWEPQRKKARMITDLKSDKSPSIVTVNLAVGAGSLNNPPDLPGLAHLCEHAVINFGSNKYPKAGLFSSEVEAAGGICNAVTEEENTVYYFLLDLNAAGIVRLERLLDIMADFVGYPLLPAELVNGEVHAVDCEFGLRETHDGLRMQTVLFSTRDKNHPFGRFSCGNFDTLHQSNLHERMCEWQKRHYAANYMSLTIKAELPLEELERLSRKYFSNIPQSSLPSPKTELLQKYGNPFNTSEFGKIYSVFPVCDLQWMVISWVLPVKFGNNYKTKPFAYLGSLFGQHCSLIRVLRKEHWAYEIHSGPLFGKCQNPFCSMFALSVQLTDEGVHRMNEVIAAIFSYLKMIEKEKPQEWIFNELRREKADAFHYKNPLNPPSSSNEFMDVACSLQDFKEPKFLLTSRSLMTDFDATALNDLTKSLTPRNMNVIICSKSFENKCDQVEPWHQTRYLANDFNPKFLKACEKVKIHPEFHLPKENIFQQKSIACPLKECVLPEPKLLLRTAKAHVSYFKMNMCTPGTIPFGLYKVTVNSPMAPTTPSSSGLLSIWIHLASDNLRCTLGQSQRAGITTDVASQNANSFKMTLMGTPAKLTSTFETISETVFNVDETADKHSFNDYRQLVIKNCKNHLLNPEHFAKDLRDFVLLQNHYMHDHIRTALETETFDHFLTYVETFKQKMFVQAELLGCIPETNATAIADYIEELEYNELPELFTAELSRATQLPLGERCIRVRSRNELDQVSRVINHYQFGNLGKGEEVLLKKLARLLYIPVFNQLRGEEHLSYVVHVVPTKYHGVSGLEIHVSPQPHRHTTGFVDEQIDAFLANFRKEFAAFNEISKVFGSQSGGGGGANICSHEEHKILVNWYDNFLLPSGPNFRKLSIQVVGHFDDTKEPRSTPKEPTDLQAKIRNAQKKKIGTVVDKPSSTSSPFAALNIGLDIPEEVDETNGYFITDLEDFKSSLFLYPVQD